MKEMQPASYDIWDKKYRVRDKEGNPVDNTPDDSKDRIALALAEVEAQQARTGKKKAKDRYFKDFREALDNGAVPAGRIYSNAGAAQHKNFVSLINCTVSDTIEDSMESILYKQYEAGLTLKAGCGIGYEFSTLRPSGSFVHGAGASTNGPLSFMDVYDKMCFTIASAGGRRGAQMATFDIKHPDVLEFIKAKREDGRLRHFNLSVLITDEFMNAVNNDGQWDLSWDGKVHRSMPARELWDTIMDSNYNFAEPGFILVDRINRFNNLWFTENLRATNPCVTGDTLILTSKGYRRIDKLVGEKIDVWNGFEWSKVEPRVTGRDQKVVTIEFSNGARLTCTPYHSFHLSDGLKVEARALEVGDKLQKWELPVIEGLVKMSTSKAYTQGFYSGDGSERYPEIWLYGEKAELAPFMKLDSAHEHSGAPDRVRVKLGFKPKAKNWVPGTKYDVKTRLNWLAGLIDSDGSYQNQAGFSIWSVDRDFLADVQLMLHTLGAASVLSLGRQGGVVHATDRDGGLRKYNTRDCYRLTINKYSAFHLLRLGLTTHRVRVEEEEPQRSAQRFVHVTNIIEHDEIEKEVYCFTEEKRHTGIFNGIMTGQCGEQPLPPYGACLLGSLDLTAYVRNPFKANAEFDWRLFERTVQIFTRMLDNVVEINGLPLKEQRNEIESKRRHGMGFLGLGSALAMLGMRYGSPESIAFTEQVSRKLAIVGFDTGMHLSREKGEAPILMRTFRANAINMGHNDNIKKHNAQQYTGRELMLMSHYFDRWHDDTEASEVLKGLQKHGSRFTHHSSIAPTGTISLSLGNNCSNGIEPSFDHFYIRNVIREGRNAKEAVEVYSHEYLTYKTLVEQGEIEHHNTEEAKAVLRSEGLDENTVDPRFLPPQFSVTNNVLPIEHVNIQAAAQLWIDSSISKTINVPTEIDRSQFQDIYRAAHAAGLKGCTTFRFNPEAFQGVLVKQEDLKSTMYEFTNDAGDKFLVSGDSFVEYEGQTHTAANLYDAIKEGYYSKF